MNRLWGRNGACWAAAGSLNEGAIHLPALVALGGTLAQGFSREYGKARLPPFSRLSTVIFFKQFFLGTISSTYSPNPAEKSLTPQRTSGKLLSIRKGHLLSSLIIFGNMDQT